MRHASDLPRPQSDAVRPEIALLLWCGRPQIAAHASRIEALLREEIDWTYLVRSALAHGMSPLLARALGQVSSGIPDELFRSVCEFPLPEPGAYAAGMVFLPGRGEDAGIDPPCTRSEAERHR